MPATDALVRCPRCRHILGELRDGVMTMRHRGRVTVGVPISVTCERCETVWTPPETGDVVALSRLMGRRVTPTPDMR